VFEAQKMTEVVVQPKNWVSFKVTEAVEHGAAVSKGDVLVAFDSESIDETVADQQTSLGIARLSLKQAQAGLKMAEATTPMDLAQAQRQLKESQEDLARYLKIDQPMRKKRTDFSLKSDENYLEYELEELKQLEKMYQADDVTEETEEIVLKRQRDAVERARFYLEEGKIQHEQTLDISMPRIEEAMKDSHRLVELATERSKVTLPAALEQQRLEVEKLEVQLARSEEKLKKLLADQKLMTIKSPVDGSVYYGKCVRGRWSGGTSAADKLDPGKSVSANSVLMTVVDPRPMVVRAAVGEDNLHWLRPGLRGTLRAEASPHTAAAATVSEVDAIPGADLKFGVVLRAALDAEADALMPGMSCRVKLIPYQKKRTLTVPATALKTDEFDDSLHYVHLQGDDGKSRKQAVAIGKRTAEKIEVLDGLVAGDKVLKDYPKDEK
jgi:multidrug resistance efflux pump